ncbi:hypothetical protein NliqN6_4609 [Naganishia liquefaciens]|uniref:UPF3 domain-containing protein n=1 Tax=Naganishia liquefaciens TaxID=104408 RepID=A0A8H3TW38_9TREE|nr:hypothetical protein NliqN6_4609 [Naganishia liquefaciens]
MPDPKPSTAAPRLKLVIRRLPPTIPEDIFWRSVAPWVDEGKSTWRRWYQGKKADDSVRQHRVFSRAYVMMADFDKLRDFAAAFDGHVYRGKDGGEYQAVVEYAPSQKIPSQKSKPRVDARQGQIDKDPDFLSFLESLSAPVVKPDVTTLAPAEPYDKHQSTPLLEFLKEQRTAKRGGHDGGKDAPRTRREREREKLEKKRAGGDKSSANGKPSAQRMTAPSGTPSVVPGQVKIAKRPVATGDEQSTSKDARGAKKGTAGVPLSEAGKRGEVKIQVKTPAGQATGGAGQGGKPKGPARGAKANGGGGGGGSGGKQVVEKPRPAGGNRSTTPQPAGAPGGAPAVPTPSASSAQTRQRPPRGPANLLAAALKSSARDHTTRSDTDAKPTRNRPGKPNAPSEAAPTQGTTAGDAPPSATTAAASGERAKRPPRNRGRKAGGGGDSAQDKGGDQAGANVARIDA